MNKIIFFLPGLVVGLLSNRVVNDTTQGKYTFSGYKKISNIEREYTVDRPLKNFRINDFYVEAKYLLKGSPVTFYVDLMPYSCTVYFDMIFYDQYGNYINFERVTRRDGEMCKGYFTIYINHTDYFTGLLHVQLQITSYLLNINGYVFGEFDMYFPGTPCDEDMKNMEFYCPVSARISQQDGITKTYGEYYKFTNLKSTIEVDKYGTFYFNDLKLNLYREYYNKDIYFKGKIQLEHQYNFFYEGKASTSRSQFIELTRASDDRTNCTFKSNKVMYVNPTNNFVSLSKSSNSIETNDFYFPTGEFDKYQTTTYYLFLYEWGYAQLTCKIPFQVKFLEDNTKYGYEIVGEIDEKVEDGEMEEITL